MCTVYFITHPDVNIDPEIPVVDWALSDIGIQRMKKMLALSWVSDIQAVFCSDEQKAIDGAGILAGHLNLQYVRHVELGENDRSATGYLAPPEFEFVTNQFFAMPLQSVRGWETAQDAQLRIVAAIQNITNARSTTESIAIVSHGAVGALLLCHLNGWVIDRKRDQPGNGGGNFFCFNNTTGTVVHGWQSIDK